MRSFWIATSALLWFLLSHSAIPWRQNSSTVMVNQINPNFTICNCAWCIKGQRIIHCGSQKGLCILTALCWEAVFLFWTHGAKAAIRQPCDYLTTVVQICFGYVFRINRCSWFWSSYGLSCRSHQVTSTFNFKSFQFYLFYISLFFSVCMCDCGSSFYQNVRTYKLLTHITIITHGFLPFLVARESSTLPL